MRSTWSKKRECGKLAGMFRCLYLLLGVYTSRCTLLTHISSNNQVVLNQNFVTIWQDLLLINMNRIFLLKTEQIWIIQENTIDLVFVFNCWLLQNKTTYTSAFVGRLCGREYNLPVIKPYIQAHIPVFLPTHPNQYEGNMTHNLT